MSKCSDGSLQNRSSLIQVRLDEGPARSHGAIDASVEAMRLGSMAKAIASLIDLNDPDLGTEIIDHKPNDIT